MENMSINRIRLEFKEELVTPEQWQAISINRIRLEFKER